MSTTLVAEAADKAARRSSEVMPRDWLPFSDNTRVLGSFAVVVIHTACEGTQDPELPAAQWLFCSLVDAAFRWAVPVFIMLSGAIFLSPGRDDSIWGFYRSRFSRVGIPILAWTGFFLIWRAVIDKEDMSASRVGELLLSGKPYFHLHFISALVGLYLFTPMLRTYVRHASRTNYLALLLAILGLTLANGVILNITGSGSFNAGTSFDRFLGYLGYYLAGYYLRSVSLSGRGLAAAWGVLVLSVAITVGGTAWLVAVAGGHGGRFYFYDQVSLTRISGGFAAFLIIANSWHQHGEGGMGRRLIRDWLAPASFGIYLVHPIFIAVGHRLHISLTSPSIWIGLPLTSLCVFAASVCLVIGCQRIPFLCRIMGTKVSGQRKKNRLDKVPS